METKKGTSTSEFWTVLATVCGLLGAVLPAVIKFLPEGSVGYAVAGIVLAVAAAVGSYAISRGGVKAAQLNASAAHALAAARDPQKPPQS
jgi:hypothetical protein